MEYALLKVQCVEALRIAMPQSDKASAMKLYQNKASLVRQAETWKNMARKHATWRRIENYFRVCKPRHEMRDGRPY